MGRNLVLNGPNYRKHKVAVFHRWQRDEPGNLRAYMADMLRAMAAVKGVLGVSEAARRFNVPKALKRRISGKLTPLTDLLQALSYGAR
jgi:hypothetical protein